MEPIQAPLEAKAASEQTEPVRSSKWQALWLLAAAEFLAMAVWFSASAVVPSLSELWALSDSGGCIPRFGHEVE